MKPEKMTTQDSISHEKYPGRKQLIFGKYRLEHWQIISGFLVIYDYLSIAAAYFLALWLRFDGIYSAIPNRYLIAYSTFVFPFAVVCIVVFALFHMYNSMWRFASFGELERTLLASIITSVFHTVGITILIRRMPIAYYILNVAKKKRNKT